MGCLKLTYSAENDAPNWKVWTAESSEKEVKGLGDHWSDQYRSIEGNLGLMSTRTFRDFYGIGGMSDQERGELASSLGDPFSGTLDVFTAHSMKSYHFQEGAFAGYTTYAYGKAGKYNTGHVTNYDPDGNVVNEIGVGYTFGTAPDANAGVGLSGADGYIPIWGSGRDAVYWAQQGDYSRAVLNGVIAISDVFLVKSIVTSVGKGIVKAVTKSAVKEVTGGAARMQKFGHLWQKASLDKAISRHAGSNPTSWVTNSGKTIFENSATGRQVVVDGAGYFRIFQPKSFGSTKGVYLDMMGKVPSPARFLKSGQVGNIPLIGGDLNQATHFLIK